MANFIIWEAAVKKKPGQQTLQQQGLFGTTTRYLSDTHAETTTFVISARVWSVGAMWVMPEDILNRTDGADGSRT